MSSSLIVRQRRAAVGGRESPGGMEMVSGLEREAKISANFLYDF